MKKLALAVAISSIPFVSQAQIFTNDREFIIEVAGEVTAQLLKDNKPVTNNVTVFDPTATDSLTDDPTATDSPAENKLSMNLTNAHFNFTPQYTLETGMVAYSDLKVESSNGVSGLSEGYVGLEHKGFDFTAGKHAFASANFGISRSKELGPDSPLGQTSGQNVMKLMYRKENLEVGASYDFGDTSGDLSSFDVYLSGMIGDFDADATIQIQKPNAESENTFYFGYSAYYTLEKFFIGGSLSMDTTEDSNVTVIEFASELQLSNRITIGGGYGQEIYQLAGSPNIFYANVEYLFHKEVAAYTEIGLNTSAGSQFGFVSGLTVKF